MQLVLVVLGIAVSLVLQFRGNLMEVPYGIITSPITGLASQLNIILLTTLSPLITLFGGIIGFIAFILIPGMLLTYALYDEMHILTRILMGTFIALVSIFLLTAYLLLFGIASSPFHSLVPIVLACILLIMRPSIMDSYLDDIRDLWTLFRQDVTNRKYAWFWLGLLFIVIVRIAMFSFVDSYASDSTSYAGYVEAIIDGTFMTGYTYIHPIGYALFSMPFVWFVGSTTWGLSLSSWILTMVALCGAIPLLERFSKNWPTDRKPPIRVLVLALFSVPWLTLLMSNILHESALLFLTFVGAGAIGSRIKHGEVILGLATGVAYMVRPTHALMFFSFMLIPLWENRSSVVNFFKVGFKSLLVAIPVIPLLTRNLLVEGVLLAEYDLQFFGFENVFPVLRTMASFVINSDYGVFPLLFLFPLIWVVPGMIKRIPKLNVETWAWILFAASSMVVFLLYPSDQVRLFAFMIWLLPIILLLEFWERDWDYLGYGMVVWMILIFGAIQYSSTAWIIDEATSHLVLVPGLLKGTVPSEFLFYSLGYIVTLLLWILVPMMIYKYQSKKDTESISVEEVEEQS
jgi:hypothetical protein